MSSGTSEYSLAGGDNLIMSDSLQGIVDPAFFKDYEVSLSHENECILTFSSFTLLGELSGFSVSGNRFVLNIVSQSATATRILTNPDLVHVVCNLPDENSLKIVPIKNETSLDVTFEELGLATIVVTLTKE